MKQNVKLEKIITSTRGLTAISNLKLTMNLSFKIATFLNELQIIIDEFNKRRDEIIKKHQGDSEERTPEIAEAIKKDIDDILDEEIEITNPEIKIGDLKNAEIEPSVLMTLDWFFIKE